MNSNIVYVKCFKEDVGMSDFFNAFNEHPSLSRDFACMKMDETAIKDILREYLSKKGISSLFHYSITCDAVLHPGFHVDEIEAVILNFVRKLKGVKNLFIIDPFFYSNDPGCVALFEKIITEISEQIESVTFITGSKTISKKAMMHDVLKKIVPTIRIAEVITDEFHDRYWIDPDRNKGIVMGTSLNGIGKKIALVDHLSYGDVKAIADLAYPLINVGQ